MERSEMCIEEMLLDVAMSGNVGPIERILIEGEFMDEYNPIFVPNECDQEALERYERGLRIAREFEERGFLEIVSFDTWPRRNGNEILVEWLSSDDPIPGKEMAEFIGLFDFFHVDESAMFMGCKIYK